MVSPFKTVMYHSILLEKLGNTCYKKEVRILKDGQEMPHSQIADQHLATRGRDTEHDRPHDN